MSCLYRDSRHSFIIQLTNQQLQHIPWIAYHSGIDKDRGLVFVNACPRTDCSHSGNQRSGQRNEQIGWSQSFQDHPSVPLHEQHLHWVTLALSTCKRMRQYQVQGKYNAQFVLIYLCSQIHLHSWIWVQVKVIVFHLRQHIKTQCISFLPTVALIQPH